MSDEEKRYVVAGSRKEFVNWVQQNVLYIDDPFKLRGRRKGFYILHGTFSRRRCFKQILIELKIIGAKEFNAEKEEGRD